MRNSLFKTLERVSFFSDSVLLSLSGPIVFVCLFRSLIVHYKLEQINFVETISKRCVKDVTFIVFSREIFQCYHLKTAFLLYLKENVEFQGNGFNILYHVFYCLCCIVIAYCLVVLSTVCVWLVFADGCEQPVSKLLIYTNHLFILSLILVSILTESPNFVFYCLNP